MHDPCTICVVCGASRMRKLYPVRDSNQGVAGTWDIVACAECGNGVLSPFPAPSEIEAFYRDVFYTGDGKRFRGWMEKLRAAMASLRGLYLNRLCPTRGTLMDFGSGAGHFAAVQMRNGWKVFSVDPYSTASNQPHSAQLVGDSFKLTYPDHFFDAITLWYVIEHLRNPHAALAEFQRVLKPGGILILAQQDFASLQAAFFKENWLFLDPPRHLWQFTSDGVVRLAAAHGFTLVKKSWANLEMSPFCMLQSALNMLVGNENDLFRFLKNAKLSKTANKQPATKNRFLPTLISILLLPLLGPLILLAYFILLPFKSGDVVTLYLRKPSS